MKAVLNHLKSRSLDTTLYPDLVVDEASQTATFYLWNLSGQLVGYQQYKPFAPKNDKTLKPSDLKYFTYLSKPDGKKSALSAWGLQLLDKSKPYLFLVEGVFDAVKLHRMGLNALAVLTCDPKHLSSWLKTMNYRLVPVCEGDKAGQKLAKLSDDGISRTFALGFRFRGYDDGGSISSFFKVLVARIKHIAAVPAFNYSFA